MSTVTFGNFVFRKKMGSAWLRSISGVGSNMQETAISSNLLKFGNSATKESLTLFIRLILRSIRQKTYNKIEEKIKWKLWPNYF